MNKKVLLFLLALASVDATLPAPHGRSGSSHRTSGSSRRSSSRSHNSSRHARYRHYPTHYRRSVVAPYFGYNNYFDWYPYPFLIGSFAANASLHNQIAQLRQEIRALRASSEINRQEKNDRIKRLENQIKTLKESNHE